DVDSEQCAEQLAHGFDFFQYRVGQMEVAHRPKLAHCNRALAVESAVKLGTVAYKAGQRLAIGRIEVGDFARARRVEAKRRHRALGALAQVDRQADAKPQEQLEMGVAQMLDRGLKVAAG